MRPFKYNLTANLTQQDIESVGLKWADFDEMTVR